MTWLVVCLSAHCDLFDGIKYLFWFIFSCACFVVAGDYNVFTSLLLTSVIPCVIINTSVKDNINEKGEHENYNKYIQTN